MKNLFLILSLLITNAANAGGPDSLKYGSFGKVYIYKPAASPDALVLFVSGDGGWNDLPTKMGKQLVAQGAMVVGINISHYLTAKMGQHEKCYYPAIFFRVTRYSYLWSIFNFSLFKLFFNYFYVKGREKALSK